LLKVQEGCSHVCAFCIVPRVRGPQRSRPRDEVLDEARRLGDAGYREIVLTGVRLGAFGYDWEDRTGPRDRPFIDLLHHLHEIDNLRRLRLSSLLPLDVTPDLLRAMAELPKVCPHLHLPLQSGDDNVLKRMRRGYRTRRFAEIVEQARALMPDLALTTDVMVGFPGETDAEFENTRRFCAEMRFAGMHVFPYSRRPQTEADGRPDQVPPPVKEHRRAILHAFRDQLATDFHRAQVGRTVEVLVETGEDGLAGWTAHYVRVRLKEAVVPATFVPVRVTAADAEGVTGVVAEPGSDLLRQLSPPG
jgi:threonylcarbamoyladenosine tRNA methylthiotransferase MtaB